VNAQGKGIVKQKKLPDNGEIIELLQGLKKSMTVAMEATRGWYWLYDLVEEKGIEVKLSYPLKTKAIASAKIESDKIDSKALPHLLKAYLLPLSYVPEKNVCMQGKLLHYRASLIRIQTGKGQSPCHTGQEQHNSRLQRRIWKARQRFSKLSFSL